ncbi:MAG TPA: Gfo/Idh/MocA family oxidoreductase [bacterium]|uniref:4-carboxy-2-hydroxymuconate-6-semialdehyde dehydrogenase n=1 Tax=candidate division TA06 bacterium ADurb.Bin417 TaxID=1852828 RepID=A0A1V5MHA5_UNCT6|nr:MAG: 4-carboxy-2-hydroxymuconate-6-semialdehyde dehydrogenase [candidate division TA06 bacterium ADurb.Bin417]HNQ34733.1 Gfo/Idh/MocA family oxidoreductase [bacterium]HNS48221.1 Gfo/Idh/MocA family oxidoreductase [bacterium]
MIKVAVVGAGHMGSGHIRAYRACAGARLRYVCEPEEARGRSAAEAAGAGWAADYRQVIDQVDAVSVAVPTNLHFRVASDFLAAGKAVLLEKPIADRLEDAEALVRMSRERGAVLQVGHIERFNPAVRELRRRLRDPRYLEIHRLGTFKGRGVEVSVVSDLMIHDIDLALDLVDRPLLEVSALGMAAFTATPDIATGRLVFEGGRVANLTASRISDKSLRKVRVFEMDCYWSLDCEHRELVCYRKRPESDWRGKARPTLADLISREVLAVEAADPLQRELESFLTAVREGGQPEVTGEDGRRALEVALQIEKSIANNQPVSSGFS